jgi:hypothetical protein
MLPKIVIAPCVQRKVRIAACTFTGSSGAGAATVWHFWRGWPEPEPICAGVSDKQGNNRNGFGTLRPRGAVRGGRARTALPAVVRRYLGGWCRKRWRSCCARSGSGRNVR